MIIYMDGFEQYADLNDLAMAYNATGCTPASTAGRNGTGCVKFIGTGGALEKVFGGTRDTIFVSFALYIQSLTTGENNIIAFRAGSADNVVLTLTPSGVLNARLTSGGTLFGSSSGSLALDTWHYIECKVKIDDSAGIVIVKINGVTEINVSGVDTRSGSNGLFTDCIRFIQTNGNQKVWYDDFIIYDTTAPNNDFLGDLHVVTVSPDAAGDSTQWTPSAGSNYQCVDEVTPNGDTDYVSSSTQGNVDLYGMANLPVAGNVLGIQVSSFARKDDAATRTMRHVIKSGTTQVEGGDNGLATGFLMFSDVWDQDPNTSAAWAASAVNALQAGVKVQL